MTLIGHDEIFLRNTQLQAVIRLDGYAAPHEFDSYELAHNFGDTLRRSDEHYYTRFNEAQATVPTLSWPLDAETGEVILMLKVVSRPI